MEQATPKELTAIITVQEKLKPKWKEALKELNAFMDSLLLIAVAGGDKTVAEALIMKQKYDIYLPLNRYIERGTGLRGSRSLSKTTIDAGFRSIKGTGNIPILPLLDTIESRIFQVMDAYYQNRAMLAPYYAAKLVKDDPDMPQEVKWAAARVMVPLKLDRKKVAEKNDRELQELVAEYLSKEFFEQAREEMGEENAGDISDYQIDPSDINISFPAKGIWRAAKPNAVNVVAAKKDGQTMYFQIEDPLIFDYFAKSKRAR